MSEAKHTPGRISVCQFGYINTEEPNGRVRTIGRVWQGTESKHRANRRADADRLALCWNAHDDLLEACEAMLHRFDHLDTDAGKREACNMARVAIAKAPAGD